MSYRCLRPRRCRYGGVLVSTLAFTVVVSLLLAGIATLTVSHYARARVESDYTASLDLAEAGINYELRKISQDTNQADCTGTPNISGSFYFDGPNAGWYGGVNPGSYSVVTNHQPIQWATVDQIALTKYPAATYPPGGLSYIATHNNNASANPPIVG